MNTLRACLVALVGVVTPVAAQRVPARVAVVLDQEGPRAGAMLAALRHEVQGFFRPDEVALVEAECGDGSPSGIRRALEGAFRDPRVAAVVALGPIGSHILASSGSPAKPAIAGTMIDAAWQHAPEAHGSSGVPRLTYVSQSYDIGRALADFRRLVPFTRLAVVIQREQLRLIPSIEGEVKEAVQAAGATATIVAADSLASAIVAGVPSDVDAVFLAPLLQLNDADLASLLTGLNSRRLPTLAYANDPDVRLGALASYEPSENNQRRARRIAVDLQRILAGEDAGTLPVRLVAAPRLALNLTTARAVGFSPSRTLLTDAVLVGSDPLVPRDTVTLADAMRIVASANLDVIAARLEAASGEANVRLAQSNLLPKLDARVTQTFTRASTASASFGQQPERMGDGGLSLSLPIYAERSWAAYQSEEKLQRGREAQRDQLRLDVVLDAGTAYVATLRAQSLAQVKRTNLERTQSNLEIARLREGVGSSSKADVFRWEGEVANARRDLISADAQVRVASLSLNRILNRPLERAVAQPAVAPGDAAFLLQDSTVLEWLDQPERLISLTRFLGGEAASTLAGTRAARCGNRRQAPAECCSAARLLAPRRRASRRAGQRLQSQWCRIVRSIDTSAVRLPEFARHELAVQAPGVDPGLQRIQPRHHQGADGDRPAAPAGATAERPGERGPASPLDARSGRRVLCRDRPEPSSIQRRRAELPARKRCLQPRCRLDHFADRCAGRGAQRRTERGQRGARLPARPAQPRTLHRDLRGPAHPHGAPGLPTPTARLHRPMTRTRHLTYLIVGLAACGGEPPPTPEPPPVTVAVATAGSTLAGETRYGGAIEPDVSVDVAFRVNGIVDLVTQRSGVDGRPRSLQDGDIVRRGTVLARLRQDEYRDQLSDAEAGFQQSRADYERASQLYENRSISKAEYDAAFARFAAGGARRNQAAVSLNDATLRSPIDGVVLKRTAEVGALAGPSMPAFTIADTRVVKVIFGVPDVAVAQLRLGGRLAIEAEALPGRILEGRITRIAPSADRSSRVFEVAASLPNADGQLKVGMLATLRLGGTKADPSPVVPLASIVRPLGDTTSYAVYVVCDTTGDTTVARRTRVTLGAVSGNLIAVTSGLDAGERVVVRGATLVADGQPIRIVR